MEIIFWVVSANLLAIAVMYLIQAIESRLRLIPKRSKKFLYLQDWNTTTFGDIVGISIFDAAIVPQILAGVLPFQYGIFALTFGFLFTAACFAYFLSPSHRPDAGAPRKGVLSFNGLFHSIYFFAQASVGAYGVIFLLSSSLLIWQSTVLWVGVGVYAVTFLCDLPKFRPA